MCFYTVLSDSKVWVLDRRVFQQIMMRTGMQRIEENISFLRSVPLLQDLSNNLLAKIADVLEVVSIILDFLILQLCKYFTLGINKYKWVANETYLLEKWCGYCT